MLKNISEEVKNMDWSKFTLIGEGGFGCVLKGPMSLSSNNKVEVIVKVGELSDTTNDEAAEEESIQDLTLELGSSAIVNAIKEGKGASGPTHWSKTIGWAFLPETPITGVTISEKYQGSKCVQRLESPNNMKIIIMQEVAGEYDLLTFMDENQILSNDIVRKIMFQLIWALYQAHSQFGFAHGDIKFANITCTPLQQDETFYYTIFSARGTDEIDYFELPMKRGDVVVKFIDFGASRIDVAPANKGDTPVVQNVPDLFNVKTNPMIVATSIFSGPDRIPDVNNRRGVVTDIWAMGVLMASLCSFNRLKGYPWKDYEDMSVFRNTFGTELPAWVPQGTERAFIYSALKSIGNDVPNDNFWKKEPKGMAGYSPTKLNAYLEELPNVIERHHGANALLFVQDLMKANRVERFNLGDEQGELFGLNNALFHPYFTIDGLFFKGAAKSYDELKTQIMSKSEKYRLIDSPYTHLKPLRFQTRNSWGERFKEYVTFYLETNLQRGIDQVQSEWKTAKSALSKEIPEDILVDPELGEEGEQESVLLEEDDVDFTQRLSQEEEKDDALALVHLREIVHNQSNYFQKLHNIGSGIPVKMTSKAIAQTFTNGWKEFSDVIVNELSKNAYERIVSKLPTSYTRFGWSSETETVEDGDVRHVTKSGFVTAKNDDPIPTSYVYVDDPQGIGYEIHSEALGHLIFMINVTRVLRTDVDVVVPMGKTLETQIKTALLTTKNAWRSNTVQAKNAFDLISKVAPASHLPEKKDEIRKTSKPKKETPATTGRVTRSRAKNMKMELVTLESSVADQLEAIETMEHYFSVDDNKEDGYNHTLIEESLISPIRDAITENPEDWSEHAIQLFDRLGLNASTQEHQSGACFVDTLPSSLHTRFYHTLSLAARHVENPGDVSLLERIETEWPEHHVKMMMVDDETSVDHKEEN